MRKFPVTLVLGLCLLTTAAWSRNLVVGVEPIDYAPVYAYKDGAFTGAGGEILEAFAKERGHKISYLPLPIKRLTQELVRGGIDLKFPDNPAWSWETRKGVSIAYSEPVIAYVDGTMVRSDRMALTADQVRTLGTVSGFTAFGWLDKIKTGQVELKENPGFEQLVRQLHAGRIDAAYANVALALAQGDGPQGGIAFSPKLPHTADFYRLSSVRAPEIISEFNAWLAANGKLVADIVARTGAERGVR